MTILQLTAIAGHLLALFWLRRRIGPGWLGHPVVLIVLMAAVYHAASEVAFAVLGDPPGRLFGPTVGDVETSAAFVSAATLTLTGAYLLTGPRTPDAPTAADVSWVARVLDWRLLAAALVPLVVLTSGGQGYARDEAFVAADDLEAGLALSLLLPLMVLTSYAVVARYGQRLLLPVLAGQSLLLTITGQRLEIFIGAAALIVLAARSGWTLRRRNVAAGLAVAAVLALAITAVRADQGRDLYYTDTGTTARLTAALGALSDPLAGSSDLGRDAAARLDSATYAASVQARLRENGSTAGGEMVARSLLQPVPSAIYPGKLTVPVWQRDPENAAILVTRVQAVDYLPGVVGAYYPAWGGWGLLPLMFVLGLGLGLVERWVLRAFTPARVAALATFAIAALFYERGVTGLLITGRVAIPLCLLLAGLTLLIARRRRPEAPTLEVAAPLDVQLRRVRRRRAAARR